MAADHNAFTARRSPTPRCLRALAPFGQLLGYDASVAPLPIDLYEGTVAARRVVDFVSDEQTELPVVTAQPRAWTVRWMERHFKHTQAFIPLGGKPFVVVMAPPGDSELPDLDALRAFRFDGSAGFVMHRRTWHEFPFPLEPDTHLIVLLRREATEGLASEPLPGGEARGPDLDKKDLLRRTGVRVELQP